MRIHFVYACIYNYIVHTIILLYVICVINTLCGDWYSGDGDVKTPYMLLVLRTKIHNSQFTMSYDVLFKMHTCILYTIYVQCTLYIVQYSYIIQHTCTTYIVRRTFCDVHIHRTCTAYIIQHTLYVLHHVVQYIAYGIHCT